MRDDGTIKVLFVYYSFTQNTRRVTSVMADTLRNLVALFFAAISLRFRCYPMRLVILGLGGALLVWGAVRLGTLPTL